MIALLVAVGVTLCLGVAGGEGLDLLEDAGTWSGNVDRAGPTIAVSGTQEVPLTARVESDGGQEDYPKVRRRWEELQDWSRFMRIQSRLRVVCEDPAIERKRIALVLYDDSRRHANLEGHPMVQQVISHYVPVNEWVEYNDWLLNIERSSIRQLDLYIYEGPPGGVHEYQWEFAELELEGAGENAVLFDTQIYAEGDLKGQCGEEYGAVEADGLQLSLDEGGAIRSVRQDGQRLGGFEGRPTGLLVRDAAGSDAPVAASGRVAKEGDELVQRADIAELGLSLEARYEGGGEYIRVSGEVSDERGEDRAITVYLALPVADGAWQWWDNAAEFRTEDSGETELYYLETNVAYGTSGAHSKYPLGAISRPGYGGLTIAVRMDEPVVHRIGYNAALDIFYIAMDFGLVTEETVDGRSLSTVPFSILVYPHDPAWGFRSALQRYYDFFEEFFVKRVEREGGWYVWGNMAETEGALDAGFGFHWGPSGSEAIKWDNEHDIVSVLYIEPEFFQQTMGDFETSPTTAEAMERLRRLAAGDEEELEEFSTLGYARSYTPGNWVAEHSLTEALQTIAQAAYRSMSYNEAMEPYARPGQYSWMSESKWGVIFPCNLDPEIPRGKGWFNRDIYIEYGLAGPEQSGAHYDGVGLDSFGGYGQSSRVNYRREHFRYSDIPLSFSAADHRPVQVAAFATIEWLRELAADMHERGLVLMTNCSWGHTPGWLTFAAPYLDIFGAEATSFADPDFIRAIARSKPCTDLPYDPRPEWEVAWHLLHDIYPGHGNDPGVMAKYAGLLRELSRAGWRPITHVRVDAEEIRVERYGAGDTVYLSVHNAQDEGRAVVLRVDVGALGWEGLSCERALDGEPVVVEGDAVRLNLGGRETAVLALSGG